MTSRLQVLSRPTIIGPLYMVVLAGLAARRPMSGEQELGKHAQSVTRLIDGAFHGALRDVAIGITCAAVAFGLGIGLAVTLVQAIRERVSGRTIAPPARVAHSFIGVVALHGALEWRAMAVSPQLYDAAFYAKGGAARLVELLATDVLHAGGITALALLACAAYVAGPPSSFTEARALAARLRASLRARRRAYLTVGVAAAGTLLLGAAVPEVVNRMTNPPLRDGEERPNIIILAADSLRADHIRADLTPNILSVANDGTSFERAYVSLPRTFPSWVTFLSGRHPHHHGIRSMFPRIEARAKDFDTLPERLARAGYRTAVVSDYAGDIFPRIELGFEDVWAPSFDFRELIRQRALEMETPLLPVLHSRIGRALFPVLREINSAADPQMLARDAMAEMTKLAGHPFMMTVFFSTAHFPYSAPAPYYARETPRDYRGRYKYFKPVGLGHEARADSADQAQVRALYDGAVASIDDAVGEILSRVRALGIEKRTIIVITADHGETLFDHGRGEGHGDHLFGDEGTHVPFIIKDPRKKGGNVISSIVRDVDLAPTLYELTRTAAPSDLDGLSLAPGVSGKSLPEQIAFAETGLWFTADIEAVPPTQRLPYPDFAGLTEIDSAHGDEIVLRRELLPLTIVAKHRMARDSRWKVVYMPTRHGAEYILYDTKADPGETTNVAFAHPDELARMKGELFRWIRQDRSLCEKGGLFLPCVSVAESAPSPGESIRLEQMDESQVPGAAGAP